MTVGSIIFKYGLNSLMSFLSHPDEVFHLLYFLLFLNRQQKPPEGSTKAEVWCYEMLLKVSRSFAAVIMELPEDLKEAVLVFYLVLRALDSVEDDMSVPLEKKIPQLRAFFSRLDQPGYRLSGVGEKDTERELLEHFDRVIEFYGKLDKKYRTVIQDICRRMGAGMADFTQKKVESIRDYELYCHYVAGLVGIGMIKLFANSGYEDESLRNKEIIANSMGLFLQVSPLFFFFFFNLVTPLNIVSMQKTNITRDYQEDITQVPSRIFYPKEIWELYTPKFENFLEPEHRTDALKCLNHMVVDALKHVIDSLECLQQLKNPGLFKACAIPSVMAVATLSLCFNNQQVFQKVVKIRKGEAVKLMRQATTSKAVAEIFKSYIEALSQRAASAPMRDEVRQKLDRIVRNVVYRCNEILVAS